ncbi:MAG: quinone-dependent dihydroorotate dehydrogenase [Nocardioidaceae bacterium]
MYRELFTSVLSRIDAERAHRLGFGALRAAARIPGLVELARGRARDNPARQVRAFGLTFPGPLGVAAGFDKNAVGIDALAAVGFAFVEIGTVTGQAQPGNERPRLFRLPADRALVNRMGFNNDGAAVVAGRLADRRRARTSRRVIVGVNIGKSRAVPDIDAVRDYLLSARLLAPYADYLVVNVSSPNTPGLRELQSVIRLRPLLTAVREQADSTTGRHVPLLVKIAPDLSDDEVVAIAQLAVETGLDGISAVNTTVQRSGLHSRPAEIDAVGEGGLSGPPLAARSLEVLNLLRHHTGTMPIISVGGVSTADDAAQRLAAGATLVQAYTAFVYEGPAWPSRVQRSLARE